MSRALARATRSLRRESPSRRLYSLCVWRWTNCLAMTCPTSRSGKHGGYEQSTDCETDRASWASLAPDVHHAPPVVRRRRRVHGVRVGPRYADAPDRIDPFRRVVGGNSQTRRLGEGAEAG